MVNLDNKPRYLTQLFYENYKDKREILLKDKRQYCIAVLEIEGIKFAIPFRTNINHKHSYIFKSSTRSDKSGLDFTKGVVINSDDFIGEHATIDSNIIINAYLNYKNTMRNIDTHCDDLVRGYHQVK